jgi:hypothetical protein
VTVSENVEQLIPRILGKGSNMDVNHAAGSNQVTTAATGSKEPTLTKTGTKDIAFVLDENKLRDLVGALGANLEFTAFFSDNTSLRLGSVDEFLLLPNSGDQTITGLLIASAPDSATEVLITLLSSGPKNTAQSMTFTPIEYRVSGPASVTLPKTWSLDPFISKLGEWYTPILRFRLYALYILIVFLGGPLGLLFGQYAGEFFIPNDAHGSRVLLGFGLLQAASVALGLIIFIPLTVALDKYIIRRIFPYGTFAVGQGIERYNSIKRFRRIVATTVGGLIVVALEEFVRRTITG